MNETTGSGSPQPQDPHAVSAGFAETGGNTGTGARPSGHRGAVTAGRAPAVGRRAAPASPEEVEAARQRARETDRRGAVLGLLTAGAAVVAGGAVAARDGAVSTHLGGGPATGDTVTATIRVEGLRFVPAGVEVAPGDRLVLTLENTSDQVHDLVLATGQTTGRVAAGATATLDAGIISAPVEGWCSIAGHRAAGMVFQVAVTGQTAPAAGHGMPSAAVTGPGAVPDHQAPLPEGFVPFDASLPPAPAESTHRYTFTVTEVPGVYVGAGVTQTRWTFNGQVPGPVLRGRVGDSFEITLVNEGTMSHSIDFHAGIVSPDEVMRSIAPGERLVYTFTAPHAGIWLYHCSTAPMSVHLAAGMHGAVIIDPDGLGPVDREYLMVQSELYLGPEGGQTDAAKVAAKTPDLVVFNGAAFQYARAPLAARTGERVRMWVLAAGPSLGCSFHVVGLQFDTVFHEGVYCVGGPDGLGRAWGGASQALGLHPAQGGFVEAVVPAPGSYTFVNHSFADMDKGAMGVLRAEE